jgi:hypothetical protein
MTCSHTSLPPISTTQKQKARATIANRTRRIGAVSVFPWLCPAALFIYLSNAFRLSFHLPTQMEGSAHHRDLIHR